jgi:hypothetical protein
VISYMQSNQLVQDTGPLSAAIGRYLAGQSVSDDDKSLIQQAIAVGGLPPVAGANGFPPSINTAPPSSTGGTTSGKLPPVTGLGGGSGMFNRVGGRLVNNYIDWWWNGVNGADHYEAHERSAFGSRDMSTKTPGIHETDLSAPNADHYLTVWAVDIHGVRGEPATTVVHTHDNSY